MIAPTSSHFMKLQDSFGLLTIPPHFVIAEMQVAICTVAQNT
jgi:hypothetical protein